MKKSMVVSAVLFFIFLTAPAAWSAGAEVLVQVMSIQNAAAADKEASRLFDLGVPAFSRAEQVAERGLWNRVYLGPFETEADAKAAASTLQKQGAIKEFVIKKQASAAAVESAAQQAASGTVAAASLLPAAANPAPGILPSSPTQLPLAQTPTYGEPVSPQQAQELGLSTKSDRIPTYGEAALADQEAKNNSGLPAGLKVGDDMPGLAIGQEAPAAAPSPGAKASVCTPLAPAAGEGDLVEPFLVAQSAYTSAYDSSIFSRPGKVAGFTALVDLSSSMRRLIPCQQRVKEEAVSALLRKINNRIPTHPYNATLRVFGYKQAWTKNDFTTTYYGPESYNREAYREALSRLSAADSVSPFAEALNAADEELQIMGSPKAVLMFSDFEVSGGSGNPVQKAYNAQRRYGSDIKIYTFYASRQSSAAKLAQDIAEAGGGQAYDICQMLDDEAAFEDMMMEVFGPGDAVPCPDVDLDGVCDIDDVCPRTPRDAPVDARGCWVAAYSQFFDFDKTEVKSAFRPRLEHAATLLHNNSQITKVIIAGHTDNIGHPDYNMELGRRRAQAVYDLLVQYGVAPERLEIVSYGQQRPIASNDTEEGRAQNRRVEFHIGEISSPL